MFSVSSVINEFNVIFGDFLKFLTKNKKLIIFVYTVIFITFGIKLVYPTISIDTEHALSNYRSLIDHEWLSLNRYSLRAFKMIIFPEVFNPFLMALLTDIFYGLLVLFIIYIFKSVGYNKINHFILALIMVSSPVAAEFFVFDILSFEVVLGSILIILSSYITYRNMVLARGNFITHILTTVFIFIATTIYQNLIILFAGFTLILSFLGVNSKNFRSILRYIGISASICFFSMLLVGLSYKVFSSPSSYFTNQIVWNKSLSDGIQGVAEAIKSRYLATDRHFSKIFIPLAFISIIGVIFIEKNKYSIRFFKVFLILIISILPIFMDIILGQKNPIRVYFPIYPIVITFLTFTCLNFPFKKYISTTLIFIISVSSIFKTIYISNLFYGDYLVHKEDIAFSQRIIGKLDSMNFSGEYHKYDLVIVHGRASSSTAVLKGTDVLTKSIYEWGEEQDLSCRVARLMNVLGYQFNTCDNKEFYNYKKIKKLVKEYRGKNLNKFPGSGSVVVDNKNKAVIVNLKDKDVK